MSVFSDRLRELRLEAEEKQSDIAALLGVSVQSYSAYEASREPNYTLLRKIADHYGVTIDYLLGKENCRTFEAASISTTTGLSEHSILVLEQINDLDSATSVQDECTFVNTLNCLIECEPYIHIIPAIGRYLQTGLENSYIITSGGSVFNCAEHSEEEVDQFLKSNFVGSVRINPETFDNVQLQDIMDELKRLKNYLYAEVDSGERDFLFSWHPSFSKGESTP
ncbi:hypothetical protein CE91St46_04320 [Eubacteriales bacterium]|nr:helix-turn-helix transcriptional regulator [Faecalicatena sp. BF-R-105]GKH49321.1 hypothetical protein CE91St46_04320 [Eubacteriales bacterium]GKH61962.1 hypothetical protein CE91St47_04310 [Eubacteriales bacterium]